MARAVMFLSRRQNHRHRLGMDRPDNAVRHGRQEAIEQMLALNRIGLRAKWAPRAWSSHDDLLTAEWLQRAGISVTNSS
jgi:hypothetical protein